MKLAQATGLCGGVLVPRLAETSAGPELLEVGKQAGLHHAFRQAGVHPVHADHDHLLAGTPRDVAAAAEPVVPHAQPRGAPWRRPRPSPSVQSCGSSWGGCIRHQTTSARASSRSRGAFAPASPTTRTLPSMYSGTSRAEHRQHRGADVDQAGVRVLHKPVAEEDAGHERRIHAVVAAPGLLVGVEHILGRAADRRLPRDAVPPLIPDDQVRTILAIRAFVEPARHYRRA